MAGCASSRRSASHEDHGRKARLCESSQLAWTPRLTVQIYEAFIQYGDLLSEQLRPDEHIALTPDLTTLIADEALDFHLAFRILRPKLNALYNQEIDDRRRAKVAALQLKLKAEKDGSIPSPSQVNTPLSASPSPNMPSTPLPNDDETMDGSNGPALGSSIPAPKTVVSDTLFRMGCAELQAMKIRFAASLRETMEQASTLLPAEVNGVMK